MELWGRGRVLHAGGPLTLASIRCLGIGIEVNLWAMPLCSISFDHGQHALILRGLEFRGFSLGDSDN